MNDERLQKVFDTMNENLHTQDDKETAVKIFKYVDTITKEDVYKALEEAASLGYVGFHFVQIPNMNKQTRVLIQKFCFWKLDQLFPDCYILEDNDEEDNEYLSVTLCVLHGALCIIMGPKYVRKLEKLYRRKLDVDLYIPDFCLDGCIKYKY